MSRGDDPRAADDRELELLKAVAQAWHGHSGNPRPTREFDAASGRRGGHERRPSRFKLEAVRQKEVEAAGRWDFGQSLWDSYEIVTMSRKLESGLALEDQNAMEGGAPPPGSGKRRRKESKNSLRNLLGFSSRSLDKVNVQGDDEGRGAT